MQLQDLCPAGSRDQPWRRAASLATLGDDVRLLIEDHPGLALCLGERSGRTGVPVRVFPARPAWRRFGLLDALDRLAALLLA